MNKKNFYIILFMGILLIPINFYAQEKDKIKALHDTLSKDDLGNVKSRFQQLFFKALSERGIENYDKAVQALQKCKQLKPKEVAVYFELGKNHLSLENYQKAEENLKKALKLKPNNEAILHRLYLVYYETKNYLEAVRVAKKLKEFDLRYYEDLANLYFRMEKYDKALQALDKIDDKLGQSAYREKLRRQIFGEMKGSDRQIAYLQKRIEANPEWIMNYVNLMYVYNKNGQLKKASEVGQKLKQRYPHSGEAYLGFYKLYLKQEKYKKAVHAMERVLKSRVDNKIKKTVIQDFVELTQRHPQYEPQLVSILDAQSATSSKSNREMAEYFRGKNDKKALSYYKKALKNNFTDFGLIKNTLLLQIEEQQFKEALELSSKARTYFPSQALIYLVQGLAHNSLGQFEQATASLKTGLNFLVGDPQMKRDFYEQLHFAHKKLGNLKKAQKFKQKATSLKNQSLED